MDCLAVFVSSFVSWPLTATSQLGLNPLADLSHEEYKQKYALGYKKFTRTPDNKLKTFKYGSLDEATLPQEVDWRKQNAVAEVKNQEQVRG